VQNEVHVFSLSGIVCVLPQKEIIIPYSSFFPDPFRGGPLPYTLFENERAGLEHAQKPQYFLTGTRTNDQDRLSHLLPHDILIN